MPVSASTASIGCSSTPRPLPLPTSPSPRRRLGVVAKLISLVSWIASTWRPSAAATVPSLQLSITRGTVTLSLARKRLKRTSWARLPFASRRMQTSLPATMHSMNTAPLFRDDDPRTDPTTNLPVPACRHPCQSRSVMERITQMSPLGIPYPLVSQFDAPRCVHAIELPRGRTAVTTERRYHPRFALTVTPITPHTATTDQCAP